MGGSTMQMVLAVVLKMKFTTGRAPNPGSEMICCFTQVDS
jgi:hypothetical protein